MKAINEKLNPTLLFAIVKKSLFEKQGMTDKALAMHLNLNVGTVKRWITNAAIPINYVVAINKLLNDEQIKIDNDENTHYQLMDQFFSPPELAQDLIKKALDFIAQNYEIDFKQYCLIEPAAGAGAFYFNFPKDQFQAIRGFDLELQNPQIIQQDWLDYRPEYQNNIVIGNPPFGLRGQLALQFINHASTFSDFICFILPPLFMSNGKGAPMLRVNKNFKLVKVINLKDQIYHYPNGKAVKVNSVFQIWTRLNSQHVKPINWSKTTSQWVKIYSLSNGDTSGSKRNVSMLDKCDYYLPSTTFKPIRLSKSFSQLEHRRGYGIVILKNHQQVSDVIKKIDWNAVGFKSTNFANNLRSQLIIDAIEKAMGVIRS